MIFFFFLFFFSYMSAININTAKYIIRKMGSVVRIRCHYNNYTTGFIIKNGEEYLLVTTIIPESTRLEVTLYFGIDDLKTYKFDDFVKNEYGRHKIEDKYEIVIFRINFNNIETNDAEKLKENPFFLDYRSDRYRSCYVSYYTDGPCKTSCGKYINTENERIYYTGETGDGSLGAPIYNTNGLIGIHMGVRGNGDKRGLLLDIIKPLFE